MKLTLYNNFSENNKLDKTISKIVELEGSLLDSTSIINPVITIFFKPEYYEGYVVDDNKIYITFNGLKITWDSFIYNYVLSANYAKIDEFNRYYFISDIVSVRTNLWRLSLNCDVLMSYKEPLLKLNALIARNEFDYNKLIVDELVNFKYEKDIKYYNVNNLTTVKTLKTATLEPNTVITYLTDDALEYSNSTPALDNLPLISSYVSGGNIKTQYLVCIAGEARDIIASIYKDDTIRSYIKTVVSYPFDVDYLTPISPITQIHIGNKEVNLSGAFRYAKNYPDRILIADFNFDVDAKTFLDFSPYTKYEIYIPYCSWVELSAESLIGYRIKVFYMVNYEDATSTAYIYNETLGKVLFSANCNLGIKLGLSSTNALEIKNQKNAIALNTAVNTIGSVASIGFGAYSGNAYASASGAIHLAGTIGNAISSYNQLYEIGKVELTSGTDGLSNSQEVLIKITKAKPIAYDEEFAKLYGKPLNDYRKLSDLHGFTKVSNIHLDNVASATTLEHNNLKTLLEEGIIL